MSLRSGRLACSLLALAVGAILVGCAVEVAPTTTADLGRADAVGDPSQVDGTGDEDLRVCADAFAQRNHEDRLAVAEPHAPFDFCVDAEGVNLTNAGWLAFLAANEYAHFGYLAPVLGELGFGNTVQYEGTTAQGEPWRMTEAEYWSDCCESLYWFRCVERENQSRVPLIDVWPHFCARQWFAELDYYPPGFAADFESWLVQSSHEGWRIQFFSGGAFESGLQTFEEGSTQMMWIEHGTLPLVILSFRGTEVDARSDMLADAVFWQDPFIEEDEAWGEVHQGFLRAFDAVYSDLIEAKLQHIVQTRPGVRLWVTGHSLGAALATLMTATLLDRMSWDNDWVQLDLQGLATFGSPRVGDDQFAERFEAEAAARGLSVTRFVNGDDMVTNVPKDMPLFGLDYRHVGQTVFLGAEGDELCETDAPCLRTDLTEDDVSDFLGSGSDHAMLTYYERIVAQLDSPEHAGLVGCGSGQLD